MSLRLGPRTPGWYLAGLILIVCVVAWLDPSIGLPHWASLLGGALAVARLL